MHDPIHAQDFFTLILIGAFLGAFGVGYIRVITEFPKLWTTTYGNPNFPDPSSLQVRVVIPTMRYGDGAL